MQDAWRTFWPTMYSSFAGAHTVPDWVARLITSTCARSLPNASAVCTTSTSYFRASTRRIFEMVTCIHSTSRSLPCWSASATYTRRRASQPCVPESCFTTCRCAHNLAPAHANLDDLFPVYLESLEWIVQGICHMAQLEDALPSLQVGVRGISMVSAEH